MCDQQLQFNLFLAGPFAFAEFLNSKVLSENSLVALASLRAQ